MRPRLTAGLAAAALALSLGPATVGAAASSRAPGHVLTAPRAPYHVTIRRTAGGIPHITAGDYGSLGYGVGYAFATDDICTMAEDLVTVEGNRSRYFGPDNTYTSQSAGVTLNNLDSDIYWKAVAQSGVLDKEFHASHGPDKLSPSIHHMLRGYVDGYNRYLADVGGAAGLKDPACHGKPWVHPMTMRDEYLRIDQLTELASAYVVIDAIAEAAPPASPAAASRPARPSPAQIRQLGQRLGDAGIGRGDALGSNAIAVGRAGTRNHHGLLLGNPHFPWVGTERLYQMQLTIPGHMDVEGAGLYGVPLVLIGHTHGLAWSHTVSTAYRFVPMQLQLAANDPTSYVVDGKTVPMSSQTVSVDTGAGTVTRTLYSTRYGPVFDSLMGQALPWTPSTAYALFDANAGNVRLIKHFFSVDKAQTVPRLLRILRADEGLPWVNTIAADRAGHALYADIGSIPNVSNARVARCNTGLGSFTYTSFGLPVLDGSRASCAPGTSKAAAAPGIFPPSRLPHLQRPDYVTNSNDSYWLANPKQPLTGFARIIGDERTPRSLRTRVGLVMTQRRIAGTDGEGRRGFNVRLMRRLAFSDIQYGATLAKSATVAMCRRFHAGMAPTTSGTPVAVGDACSVLAHWDGREDIAARGAVLWRAFWENALAIPGQIWRHPFRASHPVSTPNGLATGSRQVQQAFGDALVRMKASGLPFDVRLGTVQYVVRRGHRIPLHGGPGDPDGDFNAIYQNVFDPADRGREPDLGSSYVQVVGWHSHQRCPQVRTILTYSESADPTSPYYADQTRMFSKKHWVTEAFCAKAVKRATLSTTHLTGARG